MTGRTLPILARIFWTSAAANPDGDTVASFLWAALKKCRHGLDIRTGTPAPPICAVFDFATITASCSRAMDCALNGCVMRSSFVLACMVIRSVIVDYERERDAEKRGGGATDVTLLTEIAGESVDETQVLAIHQAMEHFPEIDQRCHDIVELSYFDGFKLDECASILGASAIDVGRDWEKARRFLAYRLGDR